MSLLIDLFFIVFLQSLFPYIFFFQAPLLSLFFKNKIKELNLKLIFYSFLTDLIFIQPIGFFLLLISFSFLVMSFLEKFIFPQRIHQKLFFLLIFNLVFISIYLYFQKALILNFLIKFLILNIGFQVIYLVLMREI